MVSRPVAPPYEPPQTVIRLHLTNVAGVGATRLLQSLLPALERSGLATILDIYLPDRGELATYRPLGRSVRLARYRRWLPNAVSRLLECTVLGGRFSGEAPLLVLGDLPIRCKGRQVVFVQTSHLLPPVHFRWNATSLKFAVARSIFRRNLAYASAVVVQTSLMRDALLASYPKLGARVHVIAQPVPSWLLKAGPHDPQRGYVPSQGLRLIYPAAAYPHKNHQLLARIPDLQAGAWPVQSLKLTLDETLNPAPDVGWIRCVGFLSEQAMIAAYAQADALLFLSREESYGFPLVEAMFLGLPVVCPDLPYARLLCGDQAIYFRSDDLASLKSALSVLHHRLASGWRPDWRPSLQRIPADWNSVARKMVELLLGQTSLPATGDHGPVRPTRDRASWRR